MGSLTLTLTLTLKEKSYHPNPKGPSLIDRLRDNQAALLCPWYIKVRGLASMLFNWQGHLLLSQGLTKASVRVLSPLPS